MYKEITIYFDTNVLLNKQCDTRLFEFNNFFKDCIEFKERYNEYAVGKSLPTIKVVVPQIVIDEVKQKLVETRMKNYRDIKDAAEKLMDSLEKTHCFSLKFTDLKGDNYLELPVVNRHQIETEINTQLESFLEQNNKFEVIRYSSKEDIFDELLESAISRKAPFTTAHKKGKKYTDAGFKDAILVCSILRNLSFESRNYIFSNDNDIDSALQGNNLIDVIRTENKITDRVFEDIFKDLSIDMNRFKLEDFLTEEYTKSILYELGIEIHEIISVEQDEENSPQFYVFFNTRTIDGKCDVTYQLIVDLYGREIIEITEISNKERGSNETI